MNFIILEVTDNLSVNSPIYSLLCDQIVTMILEKYRKKTIKDHNRDFVENVEMADNRGRKSGAEEVRSISMLSQFCKSRKHLEMLYSH